MTMRKTTKNHCQCFLTACSRNERPHYTIATRPEISVRKSVVTDSAIIPNLLVPNVGRLSVSERLARYWLQQWREGARSKEDITTRKILIRRNRTEVREGQRTRPEKAHYLPDKGVNDARPGLPTLTVRRNVTWVQPEPMTSNVTRPQQLSPDTTWAEPSVAKSKLAKGSPGLSTTRDRTKE